MLLSTCTWLDVEAYLERSRGIILPIGSTEQHGPNGLIGTDTICAETIARGLGEKMDSLVAPVIPVGMAQHHLGFPGSMSLRSTTLIAVIKDYLASLSGHGFNRFYFVNGHGGNIATLKAAFAEAYADECLGMGQIRCRLGNWFMARSVYQLARERYGDAEGSHATPSEVALTWWVYPECADPRALTPEIAPSGFPIYGAADFREHYPDGRMGSNPSLATVQDGQAFYEAAVAEMSRDYQDFVAAP